MLFELYKTQRCFSAMQYVCGIFGSLKYTGPQHLPPLGRKDRRPSAANNPWHLSNEKDSNRNAVGDSSFPDPVSGPVDWSSTGTTPFPTPEWTSFIDVFVQTGQAAGIAFQWTEAQPTNPTTSHVDCGAAKVEGLAVVGVAEDSLAARHGGIFPGMILVEVSGERITGMGQDQVMHLMRKVASQSRVLTLARVAHPSPSPPSRVVDSSTNSRQAIEARPANCIHTPGGAECSAPFSSSAALGLAEGRDTEITSGSAAGVRRLSSNESSQAPSRPHPCSVPFVGNRSTKKSSAASSGCSFSSPFYTVSNSRQASPAPSVSSASRVTSPSQHGHLPQTSPPQRLIALRFVGSRGDMTLFDRDHVLGHKRRDIEFVPPNNSTGGGGSLTVRAAAKHHRENSHRSLQDLTRDWKNDPFSTPARRRRLINDVCKVIFRSYTHAAVWRVTELRREEKFITRIQAAFRMRSARRLFLEKLAGRRVEAASVLQLGWLSCAARRRVGVLREERDHDRRLDEAKRRRREDGERRERQRHEEEERQREFDRQERESRRHRERDLVLFVQRRFRARQEV